MDFLSKYDNKDWLSKYDSGKTSAKEDIRDSKLYIQNGFDVLNTVQPKSKTASVPVIENEPITPPVITEPEPIPAMVTPEAVKERLASKEQQAAEDEQRRLKIPDIREVRRARQMYDEARQMNKDATAEKKALDELAAKYGIDPNSNLLGMWLKNTGATVVNTAGTLLDAANQGMAQQIDTTMLTADVLSGKAKEEGYKAPTRAVYNDETAESYKEKYYDVADDLKAKADKEYSDITQGRSKVGKLGVDVANQGLNLLSDTLINEIIPGAGLANLAVRSFGSSTQEARQEGADTAQQIAYGAATTLTEVLTEKLGGAFAKAYGKTASGDLVNYVAGKLAKTDAGQTALTLLFKSLGEGGEEVISDGLNPFFKSIYNGKTGWENFSELDAGDVAYDFLVGSILGYFGEGANIVANGGEASKVERFFRQAAADGNTFKEACTAWTIYEEAIAPNEADFNANAKPQIEAQKAADKAADAAVPTVEATLANGRVNATTAKDIVNDPAKRDAFTRITGKPLNGTKAEQVKTVQREARNFAYEQVLARQEEMRAEAEARAQAQTAAENEAVRNSGYDSYVRGMYNSGKITTADATEIANSAELRATWESMTGKTLPENRKSAVKMIIQTDVNTAKVNLNDPLAFLFEGENTQNVLDNPAENEYGYSEPMKATIAPYFKTQVTNENYAEVKAEAGKVFIPRAKEIASQLGIEIAGIADNIGGYSFDDGSFVTEVSYTFTLKNATDEQTNMFTAIMSDNGYEVQDTGISTKYVSKEEAMNNPDVTVEMRVPIKPIGNDVETLANRLREAGIDFTVDTSTNEVVVFNFDGLRNINADNEIISLIDAVGDYYDSSRKPAFNYGLSKLLGAESRADIYRQGLAGADLRGQGGTDIRPILEQALQRAEQYGQSKGLIRPIGEGETANTGIAPTAQNANVGGSRALNTQNTPQRTATLMNDAADIGESVRGNVVSLAQPRTVPQTATDDSGFTGRVVETQNTQYQNAGEEQTYHVQHTDSDVDARANAFMAGKTTEQVISELESKASWNDVDTDVAGILSERMINEANNAQTEDEATAIRTQLASFRDTLEKKVGDIGRALRQRGRFANSPAEIVAEATQELYGEGVKTKKTLNKIGKDAVIRNVNDYAGKLANIAEGDTASLVELIHAVSATRRTTGALWAGTDIEIIDKALNAAAKMEGGEQFLRDLATAQIKSIASDYVNPGFINQAKAVRYLNMLSNPVTTDRNFSANTIFGNFISSAANNIALPFDKLLSNVSGKRTVGLDRGVFSKDFWNGASEATIKSFLEVTLDAELDNVSYGYNEVKGNTFKMTGNWFERYLATVSKYQGYALKTTDQFQKGGTKSEITRGLAKAGVDTETAGELAQNEADYRTLQSKGKTSKAFSYAKKAANELKVGNEKTGTYGLGDSLLPFAEVPSNSVATVLGQNPAAVIPALTNYVKTYADIASGKQVSAETQAKASKAMGRAINGMGLVVLSGIAAAKGLLRNSDDDDKDISGLEKALGRTGMQWNVSATWRALTGQGADAREDDKWISLGWLPQINSAMIVGAAMYQSYIDDGTLSVGDIASASFDGIVDAFLDLPAVSSISSIVNSWKYSDAENNMGKMRDVLTSYVGSEIASFLWPNIGSAIAKGTDSKERDAYTSGTAGGEVIDEILSNIPGLRQTLPPKTDNYGNDIYNEGGILNFLNRTVLPGQVTTDKNNDVYKEVLRLADATDNKAVVLDKNAPRKLSFGKDTEKHTLTADERDRYKKTAGDVSEAAFGALMKSDIYETLTDAERAEIGAEINSFARWVAKKELADSLGYDYGTDAEIERFETLDTAQELADYFSLSAVAGDAYDNKSFDVLDGILDIYGNASDDVKAALDAGSTTRLDDLYAAMGVGINAERWFEAYEKSRDIDAGGKTAGGKRTEFSNYLDKEGYTKKQKNTMLDQIGFWTHISGKSEKYDALSESFDSDTAYAITEAMQGKSTDVEKATAIGDVKGLKSDKDKLKALHAYFPAGSDGKEKAIYRRYTAAVEAGYSYDDWTEVEKAAKNKNKSEKINLIMTMLGADKNTATKLYNAGW